MNHEIERLWKQPTFESLDRGVRLDREDNFAWVHGMFAMQLFVTSDNLPSKASADLLKLEAARKVVWIYHREAEAKWQRQGFVTQWSADCLEGIAREMADKLPRHPIVANAIGRMLEKRRDVVFADYSLTHGDALFTVYRFEAKNAPRTLCEIFGEIEIEQISEDTIATINRSLDYIEDLRSTDSFRKFVRLRRVLSSLRRVHDVVTAP